MPFICFIYRRNTAREILGPPLPNSLSYSYWFFLCKFIYSKQQQKQFFFLGSATYWININHQRRQTWKEDGSPFSQTLIFFLSQNTQAQARGYLPSKRFNLKVTAQSEQAQYRLGSLKSQIKNINYLNFFSMALKNLISIKSPSKERRTRKAVVWMEKEGDQWRCLLERFSNGSLLSTLFTSFDVFKVGKVIKGISD